MGVPEKIAAAIRDARPSIVAEAVAESEANARRIIAEELGKLQAAARPKPTPADGAAKDAAAADKPPAAKKTTARQQTKGGQSNT